MEKDKLNTKKGPSGTRYAKTPTVFQMESTECGAASLSMILGYFGKHVPLEQLRIECGVSRDGSKAGNIMRAALKQGLNAEGYRKGIKSLIRCDVPCIIHWNFNHFVVFEGIKGRYYYINDPALGRRRLTYDELDEGFTGIVICFKPGDGFQKTKKNHSLMGFVKDRLAGQKGAIAGLLMLGIFLVIPGLFIPVFSQIFVDDILIGGNTDWTPVLLFIMAGTFLFKFFLTWYRGRLLLTLQNKMIMVSGHRFLDHLFRLPMSFFDQRYAGDLSQRVESNNNINIFLTSELATTALNIFSALFFAILLFIYNPVLTLIGIGMVMLNLLLMKKSADSIEEMTMKARIDSGKFFGVLAAGLEISDSLKASGSENVYVERILGYYGKTIKSEQKIGLRQELLNAVPLVSAQLTSVLVLIIGGLYVINGDMTPGMLLAYNQLLASFSQPISGLAGFIGSIQTTRADLSRVDDIIRYEEDPKYRQEEKEPLDEKLFGDVSLSDISFGYSVLEPPLVEDFSFTLSSGSSIAFVGASGSGKSTMAKICSGLYQPWKGRIILDETEMNRVPGEVKAASISMVSQNITLFPGTIKENLTMWNPYIRDEDIVRACRDACIHDVITSKPDAYDHELKKGGTNFSGGQRQRFEIARALVSNPSILIMDEATSALDPIVEKQIIDNIKLRGCTCIIVAHRLSAIRDCDEIIVMDKGKIVQRGTDEELRKLPGQYQRLVQTL